MNQCCLKLNLQGTYKELMDSEGAFAEFINEHSTSQGDDSEETGVKEKTIDQVSGFEPSSGLISIHFNLFFDPNIAITCGDRREGKRGLLPPPPLERPK